MPALFISAFTTAGGGFANPSPSDPTGNTLAVNLPWDFTKTLVPMIDPAADSGKFVADFCSWMLEKTAPSGKVIYGASGMYTPEEIVKTMEEVSGKKVEFKEVPAEVFQGFLPASIAKEMTENMILIRNYQYYGPGAEAGVKEAIKEVEAAGLKVTRLREYLQKIESESIKGSDHGWLKKN